MPTQKLLVSFFGLKLGNYPSDLKKVYNAQKLKPTKGDWHEMIQSEKAKYEIEETDEEIAKMSKSKFKRIVDKKVNILLLKH